MSEDVTFRISKANLFCYGSDTKHADEDVVILVKKELLDQANERIAAQDKAIASKDLKIEGLLQTYGELSIEVLELRNKLAEKDALLRKCKCHE